MTAGRACAILRTRDDDVGVVWLNNQLLDAIAMMPAVAPRSSGDEAGMGQKPLDKSGQLAHMDMWPNNPAVLEDLLPRTNS